ncbi:MAG: heme lyase CcmF/NrfE family subunit [Acidimicrobiales bacterium]
MNATLGTAGIVLGVAASALGILTVAWGLRTKRAPLLETGWSYSLLVLLGAVVAVIAMQRALITRDFTVSFVHDNGSTRTPRIFNVATMWSALEGSILLWVLILTGFTVHVARRFRQRLSDPLVGTALLVMFVVCLFFFLLVLGPANPFSRVDVPPGYDGPGPNPLLQEHILMAFHPPMLYLGLVGFTVPFAFAIAALATGRLGEGWLVETRRATLLAWGFLTIGIVLGAWWSYEVLGWGGFWGWDPVENASLLPWLTGTAYLHSVMVQERRGMLRVWNLSLLCATFSLTILGTFLTRSGVLESVHAFSDSDIGSWLLCFFALIVAVSLGLIGWRGDRLRSPGQIDSPVSREGAFLANNVLFAGFAFVVLLGTVFPLLAEALDDRPLTVGAPYFSRMTVPLGLALLFLMAVAPVLPWRKASEEVLARRLLWPAWAAAVTMVVTVVLGARGIGTVLTFGLGAFAAGSAVRQLALATRRQGWRGLVGRANGGMVVHVGVVIVAVAIATNGHFAHEVEARYQPGQTRVIGGHEITYLSTDVVQERNREATKVRVRVDDGQVYEPALSRYSGFGSLIGTPSVKTGLAEDVYLTVTRLPEEGSDAVTLRVIIQPMALWLWVGGGVMALGTILAAWPGRLRRRPTDPVSAPISVEDEPEPVAVGAP